MGVMAEFLPAFAWNQRFEDSNGLCEVVPDACPAGFSGPCFAISGINSAVWPVWFNRIKATPQNERRPLVMQFYRANFWNKWFQKILSQMLANSLYDMGVNAGMKTAVSRLQTVVGARPDGDMGPLTVAAVNLALSHSEKRVVIDYAKARISYYDGINGSPAEHIAWRHRAEATCTVLS